MNITDEQRKILAHVVVDPDDWAANALKDDHVLQKIEKYRVEYEKAAGEPDYKNRAEREALAAQQRATQRQESIVRRQAEKQEEEARIRAIVREELRA